jgi:hypothetical protein
MAGCVAQVVEHLPSKCEALSPNSSNTKNKKKRKKRKEEPRFLQEQTSQMVW